MVAESMRHSLEAIGTRVAVFANGEDALASAAGLDADFYITDFRLPGINGLQLLEQIQQRYTRPINAVLLTGDTSPQQLEITKLSRWQVLFKPVTMSRILAALKAQHEIIHQARLHIEQESLAGRM